MIHDKIAKLPKHHEPRLVPNLIHFGGSAEARYWEHEAHVYRAELALARDLLAMVKEAAIDRRGEDFNLTREQWAAFHDGLAAITPPGEKT
jgi:hypothetical protein